MLNLKKKREAEARAKAVETASENPSSGGVTNAETEAADAPQQVAIFNRFKKENTQNAGGGKKRTPGEIRIQRGMY